MSNCKVIAVAGGSCSGKTTIAKSLQAQLGDQHVCVIFQDNYYRGLADISNFDVPEAIEFELLAQHLWDLRRGENIFMPTYDFANHRRQQQTVEVKSKPIIIVDGILILHANELREAFDFKVFIECSEFTRKQRRLVRDCNERGRHRADVIEQFNNQVAPLHKQYVEPSKRYADLVFPEDQKSLRHSVAYQQLLAYCSTLK